MFSHQLIAHRLAERETQNYLRRPRISNLIDEGFRTSRKVILSTGKGYGKTVAALDYVAGLDEDVLWLEFSIDDNIIEKFWDKWQREIFAFLPNLADAVAKLEFPNTHEAFVEYANVVASHIEIGADRMLVIDNMGLLTNEDIWLFISRSHDLMTQYCRTIFITKRIAPINLSRVSSVITETELALTYDEVAQMMISNGIYGTKEFFDKINDISDGQMLMVAILADKLRGMSAETENFFAQSAISEIFPFLRKEVFSLISESDLRFLHNLKTLSDLPAEYFAACYDACSPLVERFVRLDIEKDRYILHQLAAEYLNTQPFVISKEEQKREYLAAARWCVEKALPLIAARYFILSGEPESAVEIINREPYSVETGRARYYLEAINPVVSSDTVWADEPNYCVIKYMLYPRLLCSIGSFEEADSAARASIEHLLYEEKPYAAKIVGELYFLLGTIGIYTAAENHNYAFTENFKRACEYFIKSGCKSLGNPTAESSPVSCPHMCAHMYAHMCSYALLVGIGAKKGEYAEFIAAVSGAAEALSGCQTGLYAGYTRLCRAEYEFHKGNFTEAGVLAKQAAEMARTRGQYEILYGALRLTERIGIVDGDIQSIIAAVMEFETFSEKGNGLPLKSSQMRDIFSSYLFVRTGLTELLPAWLGGEFYAATSLLEVHIGAPARFFGLEPRFVAAEYNLLAHKHLKNGDYDAIIAHSEIETEIVPAIRTNLGHIERTAVLAVAYFKKEKYAESLAALEDAHKASAVEGFTTPFIELGREMGALCDYFIDKTARKEVKSLIPLRWLESIRAGAAVYNKKLAYAAQSLRGKLKNVFAGRLIDKIVLTPREISILKDVYQGLTRNEIADHLFISVNTVKSNMNSLFQKLGAENAIDAVRHGIENGIL